MKLQFENLDKFQITNQKTSLMILQAQAAATVLTIQAVYLDETGGYLDTKILSMHDRRDAYDVPHREEDMIGLPYNYLMATVNVADCTVTFTDRIFNRVFEVFNTGRQRSMMRDEKDFLHGCVMLELGDFVLA